MAITTASVNSIERRSNPYEGVNNVIDIAEDKKTRLQMMTRSMLDQLKDDTKNLKLFEAKTKDLFDKTIDNTVGALDKLKKELIADYNALNKAKTLEQIQKEIDEKLALLQNGFNSVDWTAEKIFDTWIFNNENRFSSPEEAEKAFNEECMHDIMDFVNTLSNQELEKTIAEYRFELNDLRLGIEAEGLKKNISSGNPLRADKYSYTKTAETRDKDAEKFSLTELGDPGKIDFEYKDINLWYNNEDLINIFKKWGLQKHIETIIGEGLGNLDSKTFKINLSPQDGLAGLILYLDQHSTKENNKWEKIASAKDIKDLANEDPGFEYKHGGWIDRERNKLAKIIKEANGNDALKAGLLKFANEAKGFGSSYEKRFKQKINFQNNLGYVNEDNILQTLCDFNGDGQLSINVYEYRRKKEHQEAWKKEHPKLPQDRKKLREKEWKTQKAKEKKERKSGKDIENLWDVWTIFGWQLYDAIQTASNVLDTRIQYNDRAIIDAYGPDVSGENIVIFNIFKVIRWKNQNQEIDEILKPLKVEDCNRGKLLELCKEHPSFQPLFAQAIERIAGSSSPFAPNLVDKLSSIERILEAEQEVGEGAEKKEGYRSIIERSNVLLDDWKDWKIGKEKAGKRFFAEYHEEGMLQMRKSVMTMLDNVNIGAMLNDQGKLLSLGIDKSWDLKKRKHELENSFLKTLSGVLASVTFDGFPPSLGLKFGQSGTSENLKDLRARNINISNLIGTWIVKVNVWWEYAHQFNYAGVVTSSLDGDINKAQYLGLEWGVAEVFIRTVPKISILEWGVAYKISPKAAIEQMYKQYNDVTSLLFDIDNDTSKWLKKAQKSDVSSKENLTKFLEERYNNLYKSLNLDTAPKKDNQMATFLKNNEKFIKDAIPQIANYFEINGVFDAIKVGAADKVKATKMILNVLQEGITNEWREVRYENMAGTMHVSKVGIGVGAILIAGVYPMLYPKFSLKLTHWRNNYINVKGQKQLDEALINEGAINEKFDIFTPEPPSIEAYAAYIKSRFNIPGKLKDKEGNEVTDDGGNSIDILETGKTKEWSLYIRYNGTAVNRITDIIDIRKKKVKEDTGEEYKREEIIKFSEDERTIIIGDAGKITAYTQSDGEGKRCFLTLGGEGMKNTTKLNPDLYKENEIKQKMSFDKFDGTYKTWDQEKIKSDIINKLAMENNVDKDVILKLFAVDWTLQNPVIAWITIVDNNKLIWTKLSAGTLKIEKSADGKTYTLWYDALPSNKLWIEFTDLSQVEKVEKKTDIIVHKNFEKWDVLISFEGDTNMLQAKDAIDALYFKRLANLEKITNTDAGVLKQEFKDFMRAALWEKLAKTKDALIKLLKEKEFKNIITLLNNSDKKTQSYIIDKFVAIFAYENKYENLTLQQIVIGDKNHKGRSDMSKTLKWPYEGWPLKGALPKDIQKELVEFRKGEGKSYMSQKPNEADQEKINNIFGYTAFYRAWVEHWYLMTSIGDMNILTQSVEPIKNQEEAMPWIINNMKAEWPETEILLENIKNMLPAEDAKWFTKKEMFELLESENWTITHDIDNRKKTITIKKEAVFYLMAECVNESIGLKILELTVEETKDENIYKKYDAQGVAIENKVASTTIAGRNLSSSMKAWSYAEEVWVDLSLVKTEKKSDDESGAGLWEKPVDDQSGADLD